MKTPAIKHIVYRIGSLGDSVVSLPSLYVLKKKFPDDSFILLCDRQAGDPRVLADELFKNMGLFEQVLTYPVDSNSGKLKRFWNMALLWSQVRRTGARRLSYLAPSSRTPRQIKRDLFFFKLGGIKEFLGIKGFMELTAKKPGVPLPSVPQEADLLLARLAQDEIEVPKAGEGKMDLALGEADRKEFQEWLKTQKSDQGRPWLAVAPFSKQPVKVWPVERYRSVVRKLIEQFKVWPVVFGSAQESMEAQALIDAWGCGYNAAASLGVRAAALALSKCVLYVGADSGPIHLAAAVKTPCVGVYSAHGIPGRWSPYGEGHTVIRLHPDCEGCQLAECIEQGMKCILEIDEKKVLTACVEKLSVKLVPR